MKNLSQKLVPVLLVLFMLSGLLAGCGAQSSDTDVNKPKEEKYDLKGYEVKLMADWEGAINPQKSDVNYKEKIQYVKDTEKKYNCKINFVVTNYGSGGVAQFFTSVLSGQPNCDYQLFDAAWAYPQIFVKNACMPLDDYFDLSAKQWIPEITKIGEYRGKHYVISSGSHFMAGGGIFFNKSIFEKDSLPDLYQLQKNKQWTWDKMLEIAKTATKDTNGDGKIEQWGLGDINWFVAPDIELLVYSNGGTVTRSINGKETFTLDEPEAIEGLQFGYDLFNKYKVIDPGPAGGADWTYASKEFMQGNMAMCAGQAFCGSTIKTGMGDGQFGFVCFPMGPKATDYVNPGTGFCLGVFPQGAKHPKEVAKILTDYYGPHKWDIDDRTLYESLMCDEQSVDTCLLLQSKTVSATFGAYAYIRDNIVIPFGSNFIRGGASAKTWIETMKLPTQKFIDDIWNTVK